MCYTSCHSGVRVLGLFLARGGGEVLRSMDLMLFHFAIEGPPRPVEPLRCPALVPVGGKQGGEEPVPLFHRLVDGASNILPKVLRQVGPFNTGAGGMHQGRLAEVSQLTNVPGPVMAEQRLQDRRGDPSDAFSIFGAEL